MASCWERFKNVFTDEISRQAMRDLNAAEANCRRLLEDFYASLADQDPVAEIAYNLNHQGRALQANWLSESSLQPSARDVLEIYYEGRITQHNSAVETVQNVIVVHRLQPSVLPELIHADGLFGAACSASRQGNRSK